MDTLEALGRRGAGVPRCPSCLLETFIMIIAAPVLFLARPVIMCGLYVLSARVFELRGDSLSSFLLFLFS